MNNVTILRLDNFGRGICYINDKITFVANALPDEIVDIEIVKETKKYNEARVVRYVKKSDRRIDAICPYFGLCGGCELQHLTYDDQISFKQDKVKHIFKKYWDKDIEVIRSNNEYGYRNKITLKVVDGKYGYYEEQTHDLVNINDCLLAKDAIRRFIKNIDLLNVNNGEIVIRCNKNDELLIWVRTDEEIQFDINKFSEDKICGVVLNNKAIYGEDSFVQIIGNKYYKVSYDSFFQINLDICEKIFNHIGKYLDKDESILDLYCGVGTLGIGVGEHVKKVYGIEVVPNAILNAISNSKVNKLKEAYYMLGSCDDCIDKIKDDISTIIVDPPRAGLDKHTLKTIMGFKPNKIIYVSCDPMTLCRDLEILVSEYNIVDLKCFDMFPNTTHMESVCILDKK